MKVSGFAFLALATLVVAPAPASAQDAISAFNGTWRPDPQKFGPTREPDVVALADGVYECRSCMPPYKVKANGQDQPVSGNPYYDTLSVTAIDSRTIERLAKKGGKVVAETKTVVSADGQSKTDVQTQYDIAQHPLELTSHSSRVSAAPPRSHSVSGGWRIIDADVTNHAEDTTFAVSGDTFSMFDAMGRSFSAKLDGRESPYKGSDEFTGVSVKVVDDHTIEESDMRDGKIVKIDRWSVSPDGRTMHARFDDTHGRLQEQDGHKVGP